VILNSVSATGALKAVAKFEVHSHPSLFLDFFDIFRWREIATVDFTFALSVRFNS